MRLLLWSVVCVCAAAAVAASPAGSDVLAAALDDVVVLNSGTVNATDDFLFSRECVGCCGQSSRSWGLFYEMQVRAFGGGGGGGGGVCVPTHAYGLGCLGGIPTLAWVCVHTCACVC
jgi:hypothetical protein